MKLIGLLDLPGTGRGPLRSRSPQARLCIGGLMLLAIAIAPLSVPWGVLGLPAIAVLSILIAGTPARLLVRTALVFAVLYLPFLGFLLLSRLPISDGFQLPGPDAPVEIGRIALRSFAILVASTAIISTLTIADVVRGASMLPVPGIVVTLLFHILHQASLMMRETVSVSRVLALRGGTRGIRTGMLMARSLPSVWLPRVEGRIERASRASDLRGIDHRTVSSQPSPWQSGDAFFILLACVVPGLTVAVRFLA